MPLDPRDAAALWDMLSYAREVAESIRERNLQDYLSNREFRLATERRIEIIGEAARCVSDSFKMEHPEIPWRSIIAQRHIMAHDYNEVIDEKIWEVASHYIPELITALEPMTPSDPEE